MKKSTILLVLGLLLTVSCTEKGQEFIEQELPNSDVSFTPCQQNKPSLQSVTTSDVLSDKKVDVKFTGKGVQITYYNFEVTCDFTDVKVTHTFVNGFLNITQQGTPNQAKCVCYTDVSYTIAGISQNEVNVIFINGEQVYCYNAKEICSYLNMEDITKTIPIIDDYLASLSNDLNDEQKLQAFTEWLKSHSCVIDASILCVSCIYTWPAISEISILFKENEKTVEVVLDILMTNPLKATICSIKEKEISNCDKDVIISQTEYENAPNHPVSIVDMKIEGNCLKIKFGASGCSGDNWTVKLIDSGVVAESLPCQRTLRLSLNDIGICAAYFTKEMSFNIENLQIQGNNSVLLNISGKQILYKY